MQAADRAALTALAAETEAARLAEEELQAVPPGQLQPPKASGEPARSSKLEEAGVQCKVPEAAVGVTGLFSTSLPTDLGNENCAKKR